MHDIAPADNATSPGQRLRAALPETDLAATGPATPGGIFLRQFWHAIGASADLPAGRAVPIRIMSEDYTLYRGESGAAQVVAYRCPHRGAQLFLGWVEGDDLRCVYHGWKFSAAGKCLHRPAEEPGTEDRAQLPVFPTREAFGLIYAYFGPGAPPAFPPYPESPGEGVIDVWPVEHVPCNYLQCFENSMDEVHVAFTHQPGGSHARLSDDLPLISAEEAPWGMRRFGKRPGGQTRVTLHYAPNIVRVIVPPLSGMGGIGEWPEITFHMTPVDDENTLWVITTKVRLTEADKPAFAQSRRDFDAARAATMPAADMVRRIWAGDAVFSEVRHPELALVQDMAVQAGQGRIADRANEVLGRSDIGIVQWRRILARELANIAAGRPTKQWQTPDAQSIAIKGF